MYVPLSDQEKRNLMRRFRPLFPPFGKETYTDELLSLVLSIPFPRPRFHERLLIAYTRNPHPASLAQLYHAKAIADLFATNALHQATGSFHNALLQLLITKALSEPSLSGRNALLRTIFETMETGPSSEKVRRLLEGFNEGDHFCLEPEPRYTLDFWRRHGEEAAEAWDGYREPDKVLLFNLVHSWSPHHPIQASRMIHIFGEARRSGLYDLRDIDAVLDSGRTHPFGKIVLQRMLNIFATEDISAKLRELKTEEREDTLESIISLSTRGLSAELIAQSINGTQHTAFIKDMRLARKVVSVLLDTYPYLIDPQKRKVSRSNLDHAFWTFLDSRRKFGVEEIFRVLELNSGSETDSLLKSWREGKFLIEVLSKEDFDGLIRRWGKVGECEFCVFQSRADPERDRILIREMPTFDGSTAVGEYRTYLEWSGRILGFIHEGEHWRHSSGNFEGIERGSEPIRLDRIGRQERLVSEIMADLETERWSAKYLSLETWEIARRLGENLVTHLRNRADQNYYGRTDQRMAREIFENR